MPLSIAAAQTLWEPAGTYLNTASFGLPPRPAWDALQTALDDWRTGRTSWEHWGDATDAARASFARLSASNRARSRSGQRSRGSSAWSPPSLPAGSRVLAPDVEFTSTLFPFLVQERRGVTVRTVPRSRARRRHRRDDRRRRLQRRPDGDRRGGRPGGDLSRSSRPRRADRCRRNPGLRLAPARRSTLRHRRGGRLQVAARAPRHGLHGRRAGAARRDRADCGRVVSPARTSTPRTSARRLRLAADARRLDTSPAWHSWVGAAPALALLEEIGVEAIHAHDLGLANRFRAGLGLEAADSAIVFVDAPRAEERLARAGIRAAMRAAACAPPGTSTTPTRTSTER